MHGRSHADKAARRRHPLLFDIIGLFGAAGDDDFDDRFAVHLFGGNVVQAERRGQEVVPDALRDLLLQGIRIRNADDCAVIRNTNIQHSALAVIQKGADLPLQLFIEFFLQLYAIAFL